MTTLRPELEPLIDRMKHLPVDERGYPVPWFVDWQDGKPEFRAMDRHKWVRAVKQSLCWVCGGPLGKFKAFVIGPMCAVNRTTSEPACHRDCAEWSARNCPFLARPHMVRREDEVFNNTYLREHAAGLPLTRNPGVACVWITTEFKIFPDPKGKPLIEIGEPHDVVFYAEGRIATRDEIMASVEGGLPALREAADADPRDPALARIALGEMVARFEQLIASVA